MLNDLLRLSTIQDVISYEKELDMSHHKLNLKTNFMLDSDKIVINFSNICDKYLDFLYKYSPLITLTDSEEITYRYQPKKLSLHIYETIELWSIILKLNNMGSILDFNKKTLYLPLKQHIFDIINEILILEKNEITLNNKANGL